MPFSVCVLASGSSGNCVLVEGERDALIVDCGISRRRVLDALERLKVPREKLRGIVVTHEHRDHTAGVGALSRGLCLPVYATAGTFHGAAGIFKQLAHQVVINETKSFCVGAIGVEPFPTFHDAAEPVAFVLRALDELAPPLAVVTDLGFVSTLAFERMRGVRTAVFETNHDRTMLMDGPYPWSLKQRIGGRQGHLDNVSGARAMARLWQTGLRQVLLAHLSETNNTPETVMRTLERELPAQVLDSTRFFLTYPDRPSDMVLV